MTAVNTYNPLFDWLERVKRVYRSGSINGLTLPHYSSNVKVIRSPFGLHHIEERVDPGEPDEPYLLVGFVLPDDVYPELEGGTYARLDGFRIYKKAE